MAYAPSDSGSLTGTNPGGLGPGPGAESNRLPVVSMKDRGTSPGPTGVRTALGGANAAAFLTPVVAGMRVKTMTMTTTTQVAASSSPGRSPIQRPTPGPGRSIAST